MALSTHPGGAAGKAGATHESLWGVRAMLQVLTGDALSIRIEEPGVDGAEFYLQRPTHREYWQAKRQITGQETWSLHQLTKHGVLRFFWEQFRSGNRCVFASVSDAPDLRILVENAKAAKSWGEFQTHFLGKRRHENFETLVSFLDHPNKEEVFAFLKSVELHGSREITLIEELTCRLTAMFTGSGHTTLALLERLYANGSHETFDTAALEAHLSGHRIERRGGSASDTSQRIREITRSYVSGQHAKLIRRNMIRRSAADEISSTILESSMPSKQLVTASAGGGKSGCLCQVAESLEEKGFLVLAFRLDRVEPVPTTRLLGEKLGLGESPPISLLHAAGSKPVALIIDQIDCVSTTSGRREDFFDTLAALMDEVAGLSYRCQIHLILACRTFDYEHDHRLKRLLPPGQEPSVLSHFTDEEVQGVVSAEGGNWSVLNTQQRALLRLPQNLSLFVDAGLPQKASLFASQKDLFDAYWKTKQRAVTKDRPDLANLWLPAIKAISHAMSDRQELSLPGTVLDEFPSDLLDRMASEGVITFDGRRYGFGHESFFDYCFARTLPNGGKDFVGSLKNDPQHLFRRAQLRQVLAFLRDDNAKSYSATITLLLRDEAIRPHLKMLAIEWLVTHPDSTEAELTLIMPWIESELDSRRSGIANTNRLSSRIWDAFFSSRNIFPAADRLGLIGRWIQSGEPWLEDTMAVYLRWQAEGHSGRIAEILTPFVDRPDWSERLRSIFEYGHLDRDRRFFDLFVCLLKRGILDERPGSSGSREAFWVSAHGLAEKRPVWSAELVAHWLERQLSRVNEPNSDKPAWGPLAYQPHGAREVIATAANAPKEFLQLVLPVLLRMSEATQILDEDEEERFPRDTAWSEYLIYNECESLSDAYLQGCKDALQTLVDTEKFHELRSWIDILKPYRLYTANLLLLGVYGAVPGVFGEEALQLLVAEPDRLLCGYSDSAYWISRNIIKRFSPTCSDTTFSELESVLLGIVSPFEMTERGSKYAGHAAYRLTSSLAKERLSENGVKSLETWAAEWGEVDDEPHGIRSFTVRSPIDKEVASGLSDLQWLEAIATYQGERGNFSSSNPEKGGAWELSSELRELVVEQPERFARLALQFPEDTHLSYLLNVLYGIKNAEISDLLKVEVARRAFGLTDHGLICAALDVISVAELGQIPADVFEFVSHCATDHPSPAPENLSSSENGSVDQLLGKGLNSVRGHAVGAIGRWVDRGRLFLDAFSPVIEKTLLDPSLSVRACTALTISSAAKHDVPLAMAWMNQLLIADDVLLSSVYVVEFVRQGIPSHLDNVYPFIVRMLSSENEKARRQGGTLACLARLFHERAEYLSQSALTGSEASKQGACSVATANLLHPDCRSWCETVLKSLFHDEFKSVREHSTECFRKLCQTPDSPLTAFDDLIRSFIASPAFTESPTNLLNALERTEMQVPEAALDVCEQFVNRCASEARDVRTSRSFDQHALGRVIFSAYAQLKGHRLQVRALNLIDEMILEGLHSASVHLSELER